MNTEIAAIRGKENGSKRASKSELTPTPKREKFVQLAEKRTVNAIRAIRVIGKLGNKSAYEYDETDVKRIVAALNREIDQLKARMSTTRGKEEVEFRL